MQSMIEDWRKKWNGSHNMTFIQAQLAAYAGPSDGLPRLRQSQLYAMLNTPNVGAAALDAQDGGETRRRLPPFHFPDSLFLSPRSRACQSALI
jgi:hypothetical protein